MALAPVTFGVVGRVVDASRGVCSRISEKEILRAQQEQLNQLTQGLQQLQSQHVFNQSRRFNPIICRRCNQPGHIARNCVLDFRRSTEQSGSGSQRGNAVNSSMPTENFNPLN